MKLIDFWPPHDRDHTDKCFFTDAEDANPAVILAVHQPMALKREIYGSEGIKPILQNEEQVLAAFLEPSPDSGTLILPIIGNSGVGKSHMIAWIDANLRLRADSDKRHVVRIPKSASLRTVLNRILEGLPDAEYCDLKEQISGARLPPTLQKATGLLEIGLRVELDRLGMDAAERIRMNQGKPGDQARKNHCTPECLIALLKDPSIQRHFSSHGGKDAKWGVLSRIADRCLNGTKKSDDGPLNEFFEDDFNFIRDVETKDLAAPTKQYLRMVRSLPNGVKDIVGILNEVVDRALADLIDLGAITLSDIFQDIRKGLLKDQKELVILVEDFAVLAGIQGPLLTAMVQEANPGGVETLCTMRTALAVTEGRLMEETVMTRAKASWKIQSRPFQSNEEALRVFEDFVGAYLNAARYGATKLEESFRNREPDKSLQEWVPNFYLESADRLEDHDRVQLDAFEKSPTHKHPLFPLNPGVIRQLARRYLGDGSGYRFEPRKLIYFLLRETVGKGRAFFENGAFPYPNFHNFKFADLSLDVQPVVQSQVQSSDLNRLASVVYFWGDDPETPGQAANLKQHVLTSFGLPEIDWRAQPEDKPEEYSKEKAKPDPERENEPIEGKKFKELLDKWQREETINQTSSNRIRGLLENGINTWIDSNELLEERVEISRRVIYIPRTDQGVQDADASIVIVARDDDLKEPEKVTEFFSRIRAALRHEHKGGWDYEGSEKDFARYANLIEDLAGQFVDHVRKEGAEKAFPRANIAPLAKALLLNARLLNLAGASSNKDEDNLAAMLTTAGGEQIGAPSNDPWTRFKNSAEAPRNEMRERLLKHVSARQGTGGTQAVDASILLPAIRDLRVAK